LPSPSIKGEKKGEDSPAFIPEEEGKKRKRKESTISTEPIERQIPRFSEENRKAIKKKTEFAEQKKSTKKKEGGLPRQNWREEPSPSHQVGKKKKKEHPSTSAI